MEYLELINYFFSQIKCSACHEFFKEDSIHLIRQESNNIVVRITCSNCKKDLGLAILGIDKAEYKNSLKLSKESLEIEDMPISINNDTEPINYDDVIKAHEFFSGLDKDWAKHLPKIE